MSESLLSFRSISSYISARLGCAALPEGPSPQLCASGDWICEFFSFLPLLYSWTRRILFFYFLLTKARLFSKAHKRLGSPWDLGCLWWTRATVHLRLQETHSQKPTPPPPSPLHRWMHLSTPQGHDGALRHSREVNQIYQPVYQNTAFVRFSFISCRLCVGIVQVYAPHRDIRTVHRNSY